MSVTALKKRVTRVELADLPQPPLPPPTIAQLSAMVSERLAIEIPNAPKHLITELFSASRALNNAHMIELVVKENAQVAKS